jgi:hypothetical protein
MGEIGSFGKSRTAAAKLPIRECKEDGPMKRRTRRSFLQTAGFAIACMSGAASVESVMSFGQRTVYLELQHVSAFLGPLMLQQLEIGRRLDTVWKRDTLYAVLEGHPLGLLPLGVPSLQKQAASAEPADVRIARIDRNSDGRLVLVVQVTA